LADTFVRHQANGGPRAFIAEPEGRRPVAHVVVIHEVWGLNAFIQGVCRRLAGAGFRAVAPALYWRDEELFSPGRIREGMRAVLDLSLDERYRSERLGVALKKAGASAETERMLRRLYSRRFRAALLRDVRSLAEGMGREAPSLPLGVLGFSMGGKLALQLASTLTQVRACVAYSSEPVLPRGPWTIPGRVLLLYGGDDRFMTRRLPWFVGEALERGVGLEVKTYPSAGHEFFDPADRNAYSEPSAADAWARALGFLRENLTAASGAGRRPGEAERGAV
jgi:carboxymethylenebutenolidase